MSKILVTGAGGYIGTQLVKDLIESGYEVTALDRFFFGEDLLDDFAKNKKLKIVKKDIRDIEVQDLEGHYAVCDLACLSNDPAGEIDPNLTYQINRDGRIHVAKMAKQANVEKYIISSSCSVYGKGEGNKLIESSETNPVSVYAKSTLEAEQENLSLSNNNFSVTSLRNATVFGLSKRMRFDLVINLMTLSAFQKGKIIVMGGGKQWRPLVHVSDVSNAFITTISQPKKIVNKQIFNIGFSNYTVMDLAYIVKEKFGNKIEIELAPDDSDKRDYNVSFEKANLILGYKAIKNIEFGISEIHEALKSGKVDTSIKTVTVQWYRNIIEANHLIKSIQLNGRII